MQSVHQVLYVCMCTMFAFARPFAMRQSLSQPFRRQLAFISNTRGCRSIAAPVMAFSKAHCSSQYRVRQLSLQKQWLTPPSQVGTFASMSSTTLAPEIQARKEQAPREYTLFAEGQQFSSLGFHHSIVHAMEALGKPNATVIQARAFEQIRQGKDVVLGAETGSGKTMAYVLPLLNGLLEAPQRSTPVAYPSVIVLVPNRDLSEQVLRMITEVLERLPSDSTPVTASTMYGAVDSWPFHVRNPAPDFLVVTPAFLATLAHDNQAVDVFSNVRVVVLDEADMLLDGGYRKQMEAILNAFRRADRMQENPTKGLEGRGTTQHIMSAATLPSYGLKSVEEYVKHRFPEATRVLTDHVHLQHPIVEQQWQECNSTDLADRIPAIAAAVAQHKDASGQIAPTMVFANTANDAHFVADALASTAGIECGEFHKSVDLILREENMKKFRSGGLRVLVCTDHAARGLDIPHVKHVVQAQFALNVVQHLHRLGRASRGGTKGFATNFFDETSNELLKKLHGSEQVEQAFSRRRGLRQKAKKLAKKSAS